MGDNAASLCIARILITSRYVLRYQPMTGRKIAPLLQDFGNEDRVLTSWADEAQGSMWAQLGQHIHPHDIETQHAVRQNNGSVASTSAAYQRAKHPCPTAALAFAMLTEQRELGSPQKRYAQHSDDLKAADALCYNGLSEELVTLDIHQDHYEAHTSSSRTPARFAHVVARDFAALKSHMPRLKRIEITCASLSGDFIDAMIVGLQGQPIQELVLHHCGLGTDELTSLLESMGQHLLHLDVSYNNFSDLSASGFDFGLAPNLLSLDLSHCGLDLADVNLTSCLALRSLNVSSNAGGASFLMGHDMGAMPHLEVLQLNRTQLVGGSLTHLDVSTNEALHTLDLGYNALRNDDMHKFCVAQTCAIRRLNVSGNAIGSAGFVTLQLKGMAQLQELDFADNDLKDYSRLHALHKPSLAHWPHLRWLDLAGCEGITKANLLALGLDAAPNLAFLDLSATQLHDEAFAAIPWARMHALRTFRAEFNHVSHRGIEAAAIEACPSLIELDVQNHAMSRMEALHAFVNKAQLKLSGLWLGNGSQDGQLSPHEPPEDHSAIAALLQTLQQKLGPQAYIDA